MKSQPFPNQSVGDHVLRQLIEIRDNGMKNSIYKFSLENYSNL